jgi:hypothetical protein
MLCLAGPGTSNTSVRHLTAAQLNGRQAILKMLLYKRDGSPFWAMVATCPLVVWNHQTALMTAGSLLQQPPGGSSCVERSSGASTQLLLLMDVTSSTAKRVGRYTLGRVLGAGAIGVVRIGRNTATGAPGRTVVGRSVQALATEQNSQRPCCNVCWLPQLSCMQDMCSCTECGMPV